LVRGRSVEVDCDMVTQCCINLTSNVDAAEKTTNPIHCIVYIYTTDMYVCKIMLRRNR
jgi:hypothetical protein